MSCTACPSRAFNLSGSMVRVLRDEMDGDEAIGLSSFLGSSQSVGMHEDFGRDR
jgi:hypothetical protein